MHVPCRKFFGLVHTVFLFLKMLVLSFCSIGIVLTLENSIYTVSLNTFFIFLKNQVEVGQNTLFNYQKNRLLISKFLPIHVSEKIKISETFGFTLGSKSSLNKSVCTQVQIKYSFQFNQIQLYLDPRLKQNLFNLFLTFTGGLRHVWS